MNCSLLNKMFIFFLNWSSVHTHIGQTITGNEAKMKGLILYFMNNLTTSTQAEK